MFKRLGAPSIRNSNLVDREISFTNTVELDVEDVADRHNGNHASWRDAEGTKKEDEKLDKSALWQWRTYSGTAMRIMVGVRMTKVMKAIWKEQGQFV